MLPIIPGPSSTDSGFPVLSTGSPTVTPAGVHRLRRTIHTVAKSAYIRTTTGLNNAALPNEIHSSDHILQYTRTMRAYRNLSGGISRHSARGMDNHSFQGLKSPVDALSRRDSAPKFLWTRYRPVFNACFYQPPPPSQCKDSQRRLHEFICHRICRSTGVEYADRC